MPQAHLLASLTSLWLASSPGLVDWDGLHARYACKRQEGPKACARRLKASLQQELAKPTLALAMPSLGCSAEPVDKCEVSFDGCTPLAGVIIEALGATGRDAAVALPELTQAEARSPALAALVRQARAAAGDKRLEGAAMRQLDDARTFCVWEAAGLLGALRTPAAIARLAQFGQGGPWADRHVAAAALAFPDPAAVKALVALLDRHQPVDVLVASANALQRIGPPVAPASYALLEIVRWHWSSDVWAAASSALLVLGKHTVVHHPDPCRRFDGGASLGPGAVRLDVPQLEPACASAAADRVIAARVGETCIVGVARGEWGGSLSVDGRAFFTEWHSNPVRLVRLAGRDYLIQSLRHLRSTGEIDELVHDANGWSVRFVSDLPGAAREMKLDDRGRLLLLTDDGSRAPRCQDGFVVRFEGGNDAIEVLE